VSVIVEPVMVAAFIASLNVTVILLLTSTSTAPLDGEVESTTGAVTSSVVKLAEKADASEFPARSLAPVVTVRV